MLTVEINDRSLEQQITELLNQHFNGNVEKMLQELVHIYTTQHNRLKYSGILKWEEEGLAYQKALRNEWQ
ncbi:MAG: hypothetical protein ACLFTI_07700 [Anaerolineales bacterium]|jgi:hypothetical protein